MTAHRLSAMGDRALLVHCAGNDDARTVAAAIAAGAASLDPQDGVIEDVVTAATSVLVVYSAPGPVTARCQTITSTIAGAGDHQLGAAGEITLRTRYDGPDLSAVARYAGLTPAEVVELHAGAEYQVAFLGFVPGFAYLTGAPELLRAPRRADPRTRVPAGSVAVANDMTAVYPRVSPGGWQLIGTTDVPLFDPAHEPPSLLDVGTRVRFVPA